MSERKSPIQERIERYMAGTPSEGTLKKRRFSRILIFINLVLLAIILFVAKRPNVSTYQSTGIEYGSLNCRFSIGRDTKSGDYLLSVTLQSRDPVPREYIVDPPVASVLVSYGGRAIARASLGDNIRRITLAPGEVKSFVKPLDESPFEKFRDENPDALVPPRKTYLFAQKQHLPLEARLTVNLRERVSVTLNFNYEVD